MRYGDERRVRWNWLASSLWRFRGASGREKDFAKSLGIQDQARWSRQCAAVQGQASLWRKSPNRRHWLPGYVSTDCSLGPRQVGTRHRRQVRSRDQLNGRMHSFLGNRLGRRDLYAPTAGILSFTPKWEPIQQSKINKDFAEDGNPLEKVSLWPETVFARLVWHFQGFTDLDWVRGIIRRRRTVHAPWQGGSRHSCRRSRSVRRWSLHHC